MISFTEVADGIYTLELPFFHGLYRTAATLVCGNDTWYLIDSGESGAEIDAFFVPALEKLNLCPGDVGCLLSTHTHLDHVGGHSRFREISGCQIRMAEASAEKCSFHCDAWIRDNELLGGRLRLLYTPGHTKDSVSWWDEKTRTLISGDSFQAEGTYGVGLALLDEPRLYEQSVRKMREREPECIVAGHSFAPFEQVIRKERIGQFFDCCLHTVTRYRAFVAPFRSEQRPDVNVITAALIERYGRQYSEYIARGENTVRALLRESF